MARRRMYGSATSFMAMALMTRVGMPGSLEGVLERQAVHHGGEHADVVAGRPVHALGRRGQAPEDVAAADDDADLDAAAPDRGDLPRDGRADRRVDAVLARSPRRASPDSLSRIRLIARPASERPGLGRRTSVTAPPRARSARSGGPGCSRRSWRCASVTSSRTVCSVSRNGCSRGTTCSSTTS